jgi:hypothetical protein
LSVQAEKKALDTAIDLTKQLITLSTGVITVFATVLGLLKPISTSTVWYLFLGLVLEIISIVFGLCVQGAVIASLSTEKKFDIAYSESVRFLAVIQWFFFLAGLAVVSWSVAHVLS